MKSANFCARTTQSATADISIAVAVFYYSVTTTEIRLLRSESLRIRRFSLISLLRTCVSACAYLCSEIVRVREGERRREKVCEEESV